MKGIISIGLSTMKSCSGQRGGRVMDALKIFIVEDNAIEAGGYVAMVEEYGHKVVGRVRRTARQQSDELTRHGSKKPDVILMDINLPVNMIHPLAGEPEMVNYLNEVKSRVAVLYEGSYSIVKNALKDTTVQTAIVVSAGESLPLGTKMLFFLKKPRISLPKGKQLLSWPDFLQKGTGIQVGFICKIRDIGFDFPHRRYHRNPQRCHVLGSKCKCFDASDCL